MKISSSSGRLDLGGSRTAGEPARFTYASGGEPLAGFTIKRGLGYGGFGEVYYAVSDAGKEVALKLIRRNLAIELPRHPSLPESQASQPRLSLRYPPR